MDRKKAKIAVGTAVGIAVITGLFFLAAASVNYTATRLRKSLAGK